MKIALEKNFTKGRKSEQVQASCLYLAYRDKNKPYLLIDFSNSLRTNVYVLGAVFLQLCKVLRLENHPIVQKLVDPSLFIYKFTNNLLKQRNVPVSETALNIIASMKRDWMQTGRKPSGLCGAALYMSALAHGFTCSKSDILRIVHVCEATLTKRLVEFENTESSSLTIDELNAMAKEHEKAPIKIPNGELKKCTSEDQELLCQHKGSGMPYFALGLCEACYREFDTLSGGLDGGLDPPAFQHAERVRMIKSHSEENANKSDDLVKDSNGAYESQIELHAASEPKSIGGDEEYMATKVVEHDKLHVEGDMNAKTQDESESLSDIDDQEVDGYLHNEEEKRYKKEIWEFNNREYLEEQAIKEAAVAAEMKKLEEELKNCSPESRAARELAASAAEAVAKSRKEMRQKRAQEAKSLGPAKSAVEAIDRLFKTKRLSSRVNHDSLKKLFDEPGSPQNHKKVRFESPSNDGDNLELKSDLKTKKDDYESADEYVEEDMNGEYNDTSYPENDYDETYYGEDGYDGFE
ncbi:uncharacterized protein LOC127082314 isoform X2 [Lathyrus oleraceus]|uniref:Transcription factor IIIB 90 kDa subunit n=1 Tax=Pisum sativum TaxID=3888 RepID=A0A9D4WPV6_PEA|nr:uncharacterized protein LOC127082314 isoform X2 [Pisum sativum]KAI5405687.1 hypothetical protein KIW84_052450 [Pisum sativum]